MKIAYILYGIFLILLFGTIAGTIINSSKVLEEYKDIIKEFVINKENLEKKHPKIYKEYGVETIKDMIEKHKLFVHKRLEECMQCHEETTCNRCHSYMNLKELEKVIEKEHK